MLDLQADGLVVSATMVTKQLIADAYVSAPGQVTKSLSGDGYVISALQVTADAYVTTALTNGRLVWTGAWKLAVAERTDGTRLVGPQYAIGYSFLAPENLSVIGLCVAVGPGTGSLTVDLVNSSNTVVATGSYSQSDVLSTLNWTYVTCSGSLTSGEVYTVQVSGDLDVLITDGAKGKNNVTGRVLNCIIVTNTTGTLDTRDLFLAADLTQVVENSSVIVGIGVTADLRGQIQRKLTISGTVTITGLLSFGVNAILETFGTLTLTGESKTRYAKTTSSVSYSSVVLPLDTTISGWLENDRLYTGTYTTVNETDGLDVHLLSISGRSLALGDAVVNITRSAGIIGFSAEVPLSLTFGTASVFSAYNAVLKNLAQIFTTATMVDVVLDRTPLRTSTGTYADITAITTSVISELNIGGTNILCNSVLTVKSGSSESDLVLVNGTVTMMAGTSLHAYMTGWGTTLVTVTGIAKKCELNGDWRGDTLLVLSQGAGLGRFSSGGITTNAPYVTTEPGALFLGNAQLTYSVTTAASLVVLGSPCFIDLVDEDGETQTSLVDGLLLDGSRVSNKYHTEFADGRAYADSDATSSPYSVAIEGTFFQYELGRYTVSSALTIQADVKGTGYLIFDGSDYQLVEFDTPDWDSVTLTTTPGLDEVVILYLLTTSLAKVDGVVEL